MSSKYDHKTIESKWQTYWEENDCFAAEVDHSKEKFYVLDMFPYPSGAGLHVGHVTGYTATDIIARYKRQKGYNVLHPMGWDSFGLQAEQYAVRTGQHPRKTTQKNSATYRRQLRSLGFSYDWNREVTTSEPEYYKWTQWLFTKLYEQGLAYEADVLVNYCPKLGTVLANEEVEEGFAKEGGHPVERRPLRQWVLKITAYAERLLADLDGLDWPDYLKTLQRNWIGKSEGAVIHFSACGERISVFTTCPHTIFGVSYLAIAPEHHLVERLTTDEHREMVAQYKENAAKKSDLERTDLAKDKTGVFTGSYAIHPITGKKIPIWVSDYVLLSYASGAVMGVPAHDERDFAFAEQYTMPVLPILDPDTDEDKTPYISGQRCWSGSGTLINSASAELSLEGLGVSEAIARINDYLEQTGHGHRSIHYKLRDWLFSRQRYWGEPIPILHFQDGSQRALELDELPLTPPEMSDYKPSGDGRSPLAKVSEWVEFFDEKTGKKALRETNTMPQWAGSCWYYLRFCDPHNADKAWGAEEENYWMPVDLYVGGVEHAVLHLLYARFWHKVFYDLGLVHTSEPFARLRNQGLVTATSYKIPGGEYVAPEEREAHRDVQLIEQVEKMSKSKLNGVSPDEMIEEYGADALRLYEMFMGPFEKEKLWNTDAVSGCRRFLDRFFTIVTSDKCVDTPADTAALRLAHKLVHGVEADIEGMQFNTAIAKLMEFVNACIRLPAYPKEVVAMAVQALYPFAPHLAEESWSLLGYRESLTYIPFPSYDPALLEEATVTYVVQIQGKIRGRLELPKDSDKASVVAEAEQCPNIMRHLEGKTIVKTFFVPNKLLNFVVA